MPTRRLLPLTLTALGVVYGDIGTSPLYALRECFFGSHSVPPTHENVLGVLSLIIYSLVLVISIKYVVIVMRADNQGEGGVLALTALIPSRAGVAGGPARLAVGRPLLIALGIFGTALLYGDGMITPAISVLGAVEGLEVVTPLFRPYVVPATLVILVGLFAIQKYGTHRVGGLFGPVMVIWFVTIAALGVVWITRAPAVLAAFDPRHAVTFFVCQRLRRIRGARRRVPGGHGGRGALRRHGPLRKTSDPIGVVRLRVAGPGAELPRPRRAAADQSHRRASILSARAVVGPAAAGRALHGGGDHRVTGADLRFVFHHTPGHSAWTRASPRRGAHVGARDGPDLRAAGELGADVCDVAHRDRLRLVERRRRGVRHRRHADDGHHGAAALCRDDGTLAVAEAGGADDAGAVPDDRPGLLRRQRAEADARWLGHARGRAAAVHADDDVEDRPSSRGRTTHRARGSARGVHRDRGGQCSRSACPGPPCS